MDVGWDLEYARHSRPSPDHTLSAGLRGHFTGGLGGGVFGVLDYALAGVRVCSVGLPGFAGSFGCFGHNCMPQDGHPYHGVGETLEGSSFDGLCSVVEGVPSRTISVPPITLLVTLTAISCIWP